MFFELPASYIFATFGGFYACGIQMTDTIYVPMPLYHMSGGTLGAGLSVLFGCTIVLRKKFSVTHFWNDCRQHGCTVVLVSVWESVRIENKVS